MLDAFIELFLKWSPALWIQHSTDTLVTTTVIGWQFSIVCYCTLIRFSSVQFSRSIISDSLRPHELQHVRPSCPSPTPRVHSDSRPFESVMPSSHLILCRPLLLLPSVFPSIRVFFSESALPIRWPEYWSFNFSISPSDEYSGLISFRIDWFDLLAVQGTWVWANSVR